MHRESKYPEPELKADREVEREAERELKKLVRQFNREIEDGLRKDRPKLFEALGEFVNIRSDKEAWSHFRNRWPRYFPLTEYGKAEKNLPESVRDYPKWLREIWDGYTASLLPLLGVKADTPFQKEQALVAGIYCLPAYFYPDWDGGILLYQSGCDFQRSLYLLLRESWRARACENCGNRFIARRVAQKYCTTDCSEHVQHELKLKWWTEHGKRWRQKRKVSKSKEKGGNNANRKAR
jgi:hypothetical protein